MPPLLTRQKALQRRAVKQGWAAIALGLLVPFFALGAAYLGWTLRRDRPRHGWALVVVGVTVFTVRLALYAG